MPAFVGWLLIAPALVLFLLSYLWPTLNLLLTSFTPEAAPGWRFLLSATYLGQLGYALSYAVLPLLILGVVAPAVAWLVTRAGLVGRWAVRAALVVPLASFAPTGLALLFVSRNSGESSGSSNVAEPVLTDWDGRIALVATLGTFLLAVGVTCYLAALRGRGSTESANPWRLLLVVGALLVIVTLGVALQQYTFVRLVDNAPGNRDLAATPMLVLHGDPRSAPLAVSLLVLLGLLGLLAGFVVLRSGLRLRVDPTIRSVDDSVPLASRWPRLVGALVLAVGLVALTLLQLGPWLSEVTAGDGVPRGRYPVASVFLVTWLVPLGTAAVQVGFAALAGFGVAVARPIGPRSEWLLLGFAPFLLVGNGLLELSRVDPDVGPRSLVSLAPPSWISITAIFAFTLLFRGQLAARSPVGPDPRVGSGLPAGPGVPVRSGLPAAASGSPSGIGGLIPPALPMFLLAVGVALLVQAQDLVVPSLMDMGRGVVTHGQLILVREGLLNSVRGGTPDVALGYPLWLLVPFLLGALVMQWAYLDRVSVRLGDSVDLAGSQR